MRQPKVIHPCPECGAPMKRTIGAQSRQKIWVCTDSACGVRKR